MNIAGNGGYGGVAIRQGDIEADREMLIDGLARYLNPGADARRFDWLYKKNPHGRALVWIAYQQNSGEYVGSAAAFPRRIYADSQNERVWVLGDFCINSEYRSLGPALQLQRACISAVERERAAFCYDFPNDGMAAVYNRLKIKVFGKIVRLARPLRINRQVKSMIKSPALASSVAAVGNLLLTMRNVQLLKNCRLTVGLEEGICGEEFSDLARRIGARNGVCVDRSAEYLNWRYLSSTYCKYEIMTIRRSGDLQGYAIIASDRNQCLVVDLFGIHNPEVITRLIKEVVNLGHTRGAHTVSIPVLESHPWVELFRSHGFRDRESKLMFVYSPGKIADSLGNKRWFIMHGDRDS